MGGGAGLARFFGTALLHLGVLVYLLREAQEPAVRRALALAGVVGSIAGTAVGLMGVVAGTVNALEWSTVVTYALIVLGYAGCLRQGAALA